MLALAMHIQRRRDCATLALNLPISNTKPLRRSLGTSDPVEAQSRASAIAVLAQNVDSPKWETVSRLVEDVFRAHGVEPPVIKPPALPALVRVRDLVPRYLAKNRGGESYRALSERALESFWEAHKDMEVRLIIGQHVQDWVDALVAGRTVGTVRNWLGAVGGFFRWAIKMGHAENNPCRSIDLEKYTGVVDRLPMPEADLAKLVERFQSNGLGEWLTFTYLGRYGGLRLQDAAKVAGEAVSFTEGACLLNLTPGKTRRPDVLPLFGPIVGRLREIHRPGLLTPSLAELNADRLSKRFISHCDACGVDPQFTVIENGRRHRRITYHSTRHAFVNALAGLGIPQELRMKMSAHVTESAHETYNHAEGLELHRRVAQYFTA